MSLLKIAEKQLRLGTESAFEILGRAKKLEEKGKDIINLGIGQPDFKTPKHIVNAAIKALKDGHHGYTPANGILELREVVANDILKRYGVKIDPDQILIVPGAKAVIWRTILLFGEPEAEIIYPNPGFPIYESVINYTGAKGVPISTLSKTEGGIDLDEVLSKITSKTRLLILNSPSNPTGEVLPKNFLDELANELQRHPHVTILSDEIYSGIIYEDNYTKSIIQYEHLKNRVILLDGWSKKYAMTGWRIGYGIYPKPLVEGAKRLGINSSSCANSIAQYAAIAALTGPQKDVDNMVKKFLQRRDYTTKALDLLPGINCKSNMGAFYLMPSIKNTGLTSKQMETFLLEDLGIATIAGTSFGSLGEGYLRISYANSLENIERAIKRISNYISINGWSRIDRKK